ncbi:isopentenyl-diphosphate delta-isomerase type 1 fused to squalene synthase [Tribonema minus]|uniref:Isopentenyl-diphosphate delta-isomerase type 1 fused to squalene synthase n=1 Tax=Tribonema minus TaxID=303371 RepID=A0A835Z055_9STRA|nr:isopentenyl-diphosphate delta-isomerase type 1 fused to squalene synthase [Tribonema minus]
MAAGAQWDGNSMTQDEMMIKDQVIVLDDDDNIIGQGSKWETHRFVPGQPRGILHRAFSVFLFNGEGKLLLQQRAAEKITFPNVWTNTCCSHPLTGFTPTEVDRPEDLADGSVMGVKRAAVRKLDHELGIPAEAVPLSAFKFLTRLHYYAADIVTHGKHSPWGEHEIDYILFIQLSAEPAMKANPEEVSDTRWVSAEELVAMMKEPGLLWSPWFRIIAERWLLPLWWKDLGATLSTDVHVDTKQINRFDPPPEHRGGAGVCGLRDEKDASSSKKKQGAYGKVPVFEESKLRQLARVDEVFMALAYKAGYGGGASNVKIGADLGGHRAFCDDMLGRVSRSFAAVIRQLPPQLCMDVLVFYLVLRALDTVEDDMTAFGSPEDKIHCLRAFHATVLVGLTQNLGSGGGKQGRASVDKFLTANGMVGVGEGDERALLEQFMRVTQVYGSLNSGSRTVIREITRDMGAGMAEFVSKDLGQGTATLEEYNLYCHYVAGLVGQGLSRLFAVTQVELPGIASRMDLANSMGLFLQKTNIIRDYLEDYVDGRAFWPAEVWKKHAVKTGLLGELALPQNARAARACLNELVTDALELIPDCLEYMDQVLDDGVFKFCAIPQVMAAATLAEVYDSERLFRGVVKLRKGRAVKLILSSGTPHGLARHFRAAVRSIAQRVPRNDPSAERTRALCDRLLAALAPRCVAPRAPFAVVVYRVALIALACRHLSRHLAPASGAPLGYVIAPGAALTVMDVVMAVISLMTLGQLFEWAATFVRPAAPAAAAKPKQE